MLILLQLIVLRDSEFAVLVILSLDSFLMLNAVHVLIIKGDGDLFVDIDVLEDLLMHFIVGV